MTEIKLIREDFDSLDPNSREFDVQYMNPWDCPIARALRREFPNEGKLGVNCREVIIGNKRIRTNNDIGILEVSRVATEISKGNEFGIIDFGVDIKTQ